MEPGRNMNGFGLLSRKLDAPLYATICVLMGLGACKETQSTTVEPSTASSTENASVLPTKPQAATKGSPPSRASIQKPMKPKDTRDSCPEGEQQLPTFQGCVPQILEASFAKRSVEVGVLAPIDPDKLAAVLDINALRESIRPYVNMDPSRGEALCSLFQTGEEELSPQDVRWLQGIAQRDPEIEGRYLALTLSAILTKKASSTTVDAVLRAIEGRIIRSIEATPPKPARTRRMLANYLMTARVFRARQETDTIQRATKILFPTGKLKVPKKLHVGFLEEVVIAHLLGWPHPKDAIRQMIERSRQNPKDPTSQVVFSDCTDRPCRYKAYQNVMSIDQLVGIWTPKERRSLLDTLLGSLEKRSIFGHVRDYGLEPSDLWIRSRCDFFCSVKHWTVLVTLNHLLDATQQ